jgi:small conductance mechanosensitive channel
LPDPAQLASALPALFSPALKILVVAFVALIALRFISPVVRRSITRMLLRGSDKSDPQHLTREDIERRVATLSALAEWLLRLLVSLTAGVVILIALDLTAVLAAAAIVIAAIAVVAQDVIRDYVSGTIIVLENQFGIGDYVNVANVSGTVESFSLRRTILRTDDGDLVSVPNSEIRIARNLTRTWARVNLEVSIADPSRVDDAVQAIDAANQSLMTDQRFKAALLEPPTFLGVTGFDDTGVRLLIRGRIRAVDRLTTIGEYRRRLLDALLARGLQPSMSRHVTVAATPVAAPIVTNGAKGSRRPRTPDR